MRREHDFYPTPGWATREMLKRVSVYGRVLEPCVGAGDMARELQRGRDREVITNDLDRNHSAMTHEDATDPAWWRAIGDIDWTVTNPPFIVAADILRLAFKYSRRGVAMLLRLSFLEPCEGRGAWLAKHPPSTLIVLPRISFTGDGNTDSVTCAWMVWPRFHATGEIEIVNLVDERQGSLLER